MEKIIKHFLIELESLEYDVPYDSEVYRKVKEIKSQLEELNELLKT